jgi:hypothetical protein
VVATEDALQLAPALGERLRKDEAPGLIGSVAIQRLDDGVEASEGAGFSHARQVERVFIEKAFDGTERLKRRSLDCSHSFS